MAALTTRQSEIISDNLKAFRNNFDSIRIEKDINGGFYVFCPAESDSYIQYCYDINYLNGWLYGVVQGVNRGEFKHSKLETVNPEFIQKYATKRDINGNRYTLEINHTKKTFKKDYNVLFYDGYTEITQRGRKQLVKDLEQNNYTEIF